MAVEGAFGPFEGRLSNEGERVVLRDADGQIVDDCEPGDPVPEEERGGYETWLASNVLEFTSDAYDTVMYDNDGNAVKLPGYRVDALTDFGNGEKTVKGGSFLDPPERCRADASLGYPPWQNVHNTGFRIVVND